MLLTIVGPIRRTAILIAPSPAAVLSIRALAANRTPDRNSRSNWPLARNSSTRQAWRSPAGETGRPAAALLPPQNAEFLPLLQLRHSSKGAN
jgi:hypothetical protein